MAGKRNRIIDIVNYLESKDVTINIGKNKARGNNGFFRAGNGNLRIDLSNSLNEEDLLKVLVHEFAHFIHYKCDSSLKSLENLLGEGYENVYLEDLLNLTVSSIPKKSIKPLFNKKKYYTDIVKLYSDKLKMKYADFKSTCPYKPIEKEILKNDLKYLLKHDNVCLKLPFKIKKYSVDNLDKYCNDTDIICYIKLKSAQRAIKRISSKMSRLNRYYNSHSELFARSIVYYIFSPNEMKKSANKLYNKYNELIESKINPYFNDLIKILQ